MRRRKESIDPFLETLRTGEVSWDVPPPEVGTMMVTDRKGQERTGQEDLPRQGT